MSLLNLASSNYIIRLQLIIARAGQNDSLRWWDDDSLTEAGAYLLERLFPFSPHLQGRKLALLAAKKRHDAIFLQDVEVLHLFQLSDDIDRDQEIKVLDLPNEPIKTSNALKEILDHFIETPPSIIDSDSLLADGRLLIEMPSSSITMNMVNQLAWAYLLGKPGKPVFPYIHLI